jgi:hypothetical protein
MKLTRRRLLAEFGPYGPSLRGTTGFQTPLSATTYPYNLNPCLEKQRAEAAERRRVRLKELALDWTVKCPSAKNKKKSSRLPDDAARIQGVPELSPAPVR